MWIVCRSAVRRPAERPGGLRPAGVWRFWWRRQAAVSARRWHKPPTQATPQREAVGVIRSRTPEQLFLCERGAAEHNHQAQNLVHSSHRQVCGEQRSAWVLVLHAAVERLLLAGVPHQYGAQQGGKAAGVGGRHAERVGGWSFPRASLPAAESCRQMEEQDSSTNLPTLLVRHAAPHRSDPSAAGPKGRVVS